MAFVIGCEVVNGFLDENAGLHISFGQHYLKYVLEKVSHGADEMDREAHMAMEILADAHRVIALDLVEVNPVLDLQNTTAVLAAELAASALGLRIL